MSLLIAIWVLVVLALCAIMTLVYGALRWRSKTTAVRAVLLAARVPSVPAIYDARELEPLPAPVQRYFRATLQHGQAMIAGVRVRQEGQFRQGEADASWRPFSATQLVTVRPPGFDWDARIGWPVGAKCLYVMPMRPAKACCTRRCSA